MTTPSHLERRLRDSLRSLVAASAGVPRARINAWADRPPRGTPHGDALATVLAVTGVAKACRPDLDDKGARRWLRRQLKGGEMTWARLAQLCTGLGVDVSALFAEASS